MENTPANPTPVNTINPPSQKAAHREAKQAGRGNDELLIRVLDGDIRRILPNRRLRFASRSLISALDAAEENPDEYQHIQNAIGRGWIVDGRGERN